MDKSKNLKKLRCLREELISIDKDQLTEQQCVELDQINKEIISSLTDEEILDASERALGKLPAQGEEYLKKPKAS